MPPNHQSTGFDTQAKPPTNHLTTILRVYVWKFCVYVVRSQLSFFVLCINTYILLMIITNEWTNERTFYELNFLQFPPEHPPNIPHNEFSFFFSPFPNSEIDVCAPNPRTTPPHSGTTFHLAMWIGNRGCLMEILALLSIRVCVCVFEENVKGNKNRWFTAYTG